MNRISTHFHKREYRTLSRSCGTVDCQRHPAADAGAVEGTPGHRIKREMFSICQKMLSGEKDFDKPRLDEV